MKIKDLINELRFYDPEMEVYVEFDGKKEMLCCHINKIRLSKGFPVGFMICVDDGEFKEMFKEIENAI